MRRSKFREEQVIGILTEHKAGLTAAEICRKYGISNAPSTSGGAAMAAWRWRTPTAQGLVEEKKLKKLLAVSVLDVSTSREMLGKKRFRCPGVVDDFSRECLALMADSSLAASLISDWPELAPPRWPEKWPPLTYQTWWSGLRRRQHHRGRLGNQAALAVLSCRPAARTGAAQRR